MAAASFVDNRSRFRAAILAGTIELAAVIALVNGLAAGGALPQQTSLTSIFSIDPKPSPSPTPPPPPPRQRSKASGKAAPPNERSLAAPVLAVPLPLPSLAVPAAIKPVIGRAPTNGAADRPGPGSGAGGQGDGTGSGGFGNGPGEGDGDDGAELLGGRITDDDYPRAARDARAQGRTETEIGVDARGRGTGCRIIRSSGNDLLDATVCRLALKRFRFRAARDAAGQAIPGSIYFDHKWEIGRIEDDPGA